MPPSRRCPLLARLRRATADDERAAAVDVVDQVHDLLGHHAAREDRGVFSELAAADVATEYLAAFEADHERIHALVAAARSPAWREATTELIALLGSHIAREESDLFPAAHQLLQPKQWDAVDAVHAEVGTRDDAAPPD
jgi:hemerythrin-like domain-containing protein